MLKYFLVAIACFLGGTLRAQQAPIPRSMGSLGDSISTGVLASKTYADSKDMAKVMDLIFGVVLMRQFDYPNELEDRSMNWSTGRSRFVFSRKKRVYSHADRIRRLLPFYKRLKVHVAAFNGANMHDVATIQLPKLNRWSKKQIDKEYPDYITLHVGGNDICTKTLDEMTTSESFENDLNSILEEVLSHSKNSRILLVPLPDIREHAQKMGPVVRLDRGTCRDFWQRYKHCPVLNLPTSPEALKVAQERILKYTQILKNKALDFQKRFGDRVRFAGQAFTDDYSPRDMSVDCFHLSYYGQKKLSAKTWEASWWR